MFKENFRHKYFEHNWLCINYPPFFLTFLIFCMKTKLPASIPAWCKAASSWHMPANWVSSPGLMTLSTPWTFVSTTPCRFKEVIDDIMRDTSVPVSVCAALSSLTSRAFSDLWNKRLEFDDISLSSIPPHCTRRYLLTKDILDSNKLGNGGC